MERPRILPPKKALTRSSILKLSSRMEFLLKNLALAWSVLTKGKQQGEGGKNRKVIKQIHPLSCHDTCWM